MTSVLVTLLLSVGAFGFLGLSVLCPFLAMVGYYFQRRTFGKRELSDAHASGYPARLDILIPAFNEADSIGATLTSIQRSIQHLRSRPSTPPGPNIFIRVDADGCTDQTAQVARQFPSVSVSESAVNQSKWATLKNLIAGSTSDWVVLVDAGTLWPETWLTELVERIGRDRTAIAMAPSYRPLQASRLHCLVWQVEKTLKSLETLSGGPVSLHGATVAYKTSLLKDALVHLGDTQWLNDDVVIPLTLRSLCPEGIILYPVGQVQDAGVKHDRPDLGRRKRMLLGNLQWVRSLLWDCCRRNPVAGVIACRRLFRVFWAYWVAGIALALILTFHVLLLPGLAGLMVLMIWSSSVRQLGGAALVSLSTPLFMMRPNKPFSGAWR